MDRIHVDVMDGRFVPRLGLYPEFVREIRASSSLPIDIHMMMENPERRIEDFAEAGATRIIPHLESTVHIDHLVRQIRALGVEAGLALNPHTLPSNLDYMLEDLAVVTVMAINPGIVGHKFIPKSLEKISSIRTYLSQHGFGGVIEVDGGVTFDNIASLKESGAKILVVGAGSIFYPDATSVENLERLNQLR